jgi:hypothetical protein
MRSIPRPLIGLYAAAQLPLDYSIKFYRQLQDNIRVNRRGTDRLRLRAPARPRCPVSQCLKIRSAWVNKNQSQYAVTTIKIAEKLKRLIWRVVPASSAETQNVLPQLRNKAAERSMIARRLRHAGSGWGRQYPVRIRSLHWRSVATKLDR